nr:hypothetical protein CFP56_54559 [Quercus suber]
MAAAALPACFSPNQTHFLSGSLKPTDRCLLNISTCDPSLTPGFQRKAKLTTSKTPFTVRAGGDGGRPNTASIFVGGFVLGGMVVGTLGCIYAPQISKALAGVDRKDLMRKLPKFIYDEEKALELNSAIDDVSAHLHGDDAPNGAIVNSDEVGASM